MTASKVGIFEKELKWYQKLNLAMCVKIHIGAAATTGTEAAPLPPNWGWLVECAGNIFSSFGM